MSTIITLTASDGSTVQFVNERKASGGLKDVFFAPDKRYVVAFYRDKLDHVARERLALITGTYRERIFNQEGGDYLRNLLCWPTATVEHEGRVGVVVPFFADHFFFKYGSRNDDQMLGIRNREKEGKWFASAKNRSRFLDTRELGDGLTQLKTCIMMARAVRRLHSAGLAHSDLSYKNVLVDPSSGRACLIDLDGLVVPNKFPPEVAGTPDFFAPEVVATSRLDRHDPNRRLPSRLTDQHALAVLIYMNLLFRHPLRGDKVHDLNDTQRDEELAMGEKALFIEHPTDTSNRVKLANVPQSELPWKDTESLPYTLTGPYLSELIQRAFMDGLHIPNARPTADEWETALVKTADLLQPCQNPQCTQKWFVFDNTTKPCCPYCGTPFRGKLPVLNLYSSHKEGSFRTDNHRLMVYSGQSVFRWHASRLVFPNERLSAEQARRVGYFVLHNNDWYFVNEALTSMRDVTGQQDIPIGKEVKLEDGHQILFSRETGGRLAVIQMVCQ
ncbi:MAG: lipopolysaccharide kinase InaA family protein [Rhodocyclaceae bacterium]|jgi:serine/threonine protein kinase|nr:lipopolysaccharide kinase InaA family protein [Rhodocyclaceae bacterium]